MFWIQRPPRWSARVLDARQNDIAADRGCPYLDEMSTMGIHYRSQLGDEAASWRHSHGFDQGNYFDTYYLSAIHRAEDDRDLILASQPMLSHSRHRTYWRRRK